MAEISLRQYLNDIDEMIDKKQVDEAIAHCRHILSYYPKNLDTYRTLGKALLEKGRHGDAADIFQRVLSAAPDDFVSHVGMSIVREDEANLEAALWHMERAFEASPGNGAIHDELRRLYGRRDGLVPPKARLTRGALARMYTKGALYPQAEAELRTALAEDPERVDLATVLARVYWLSDQRAQAAETCNSILQKLPYSREANRILADLLQAQGRAEDAILYRQRLEALDPYEAFADPSADGQGAALANPDAVRIPMMDFMSVATEGTSAAPDWMTSIGEKFEEQEAALAASATPDWLRDSSLAEIPAAELPTPGNLPDWMKEMQPEAEAPVPAEFAAPDWLIHMGETGESPAAPIPAESMPDWLRAATGQLEPEKASAPPQAEPVAPPPVEEEDIPEWMRPATAPLAAEDLPDWMRTAGLTPPAPAPAEQPKPATSKLAPATPSAPSSDIPDWMKPATDRLSPEDLPDWMKAGAAPDVPSPAFAPPPLPPTPAQPPESRQAGEEDIPDWMKPATGSLTADELPDWMKPAPTPAETEPAEQPESRLAGQAGDEVPDWMLAATKGPAAFVETPEISETNVAALDDDEAMRWLEGLAAQQGAKPEELITQPAQPTEATPAFPPGEEALELPEWMKAQPESVDAAPALKISEDEKPDWLKQMEAEADQYEASVTPPAIQPPVELPDFLQMASPEAIARANEPTHLADEIEAEKENWLAEVMSTPSAETAQTEEAELPAAEIGELPDWIKQMAPADLTAPAAETSLPPAAPAPAERDLSEMDADEAMRWLEGLAKQEALQQGAKPEEMVTQPEDEEIEAPQWLRPPAEEPETPAPPPADLPAWAQAEEPGPTDTIVNWLAGKETPEWLRKPGEEAPQPPAEWLRAPAEEEELPPAVPTDELPDWLKPPAESATLETPAKDLGSMSDEEALKWLEGLAAQQGALAEELLTPPEERTTRPLTWLSPQKSAPAQPAQSPEEDLPDFLRKREPAMPEPAPAAPAPDVSAMDDDEAMRWLESLAAQQGAKPEELITSPEERIAEPPIYEVAAQSRPAGRAGQPTEREALAAEDRPGWLGQSEAASPAESPQGEVMSMEATSPITSEAPPADLGSMSEDDAMRWLEGLAAQQGAKPEELITTPSFGEQTLEAPVYEVASQQAEIESITSPAEESEEEAPAQSSLSEDDAMRWLERLALQQGARPEELVTSPTLGEPPVYEITDQETEPPYEAGQPTEPAPEPVSAPVEELPDWLRQTQAPATTAEVEQPTAGLPPTLAAALEETEAPPVTFAAPAVEEKPAPTPEPKPQEEQPEEDRDSRLARLSERLATSRRAREAEIEARFASQRAGQEAARLEVQRKMEQKQAQMAAPPTARPSTGRLGTGPLGAQPGTGRLGTPEPEAAPEPIPPTAETQAALPPEPTQPVETPAPTAAVPQPAPRPRTQAIVSARAQSGSDQSPFAAETPENVLATARQHLGDDDHERAAEGLSYLISIGSGVDEVIATLERYSSRNQMSPLLLSVLGDAYMQNNHLQKALDTYRQALAQL